MRVNSFVSAAALSAAMLFSGSAFAQTMYNGVDVSADDLPALQQRCDDLANATAVESISETDTSDSENAGDAEGASTTPDVNELQNATTTLDLDTVTLEGCTEAGLTTAM